MTTLPILPAIDYRIPQWEPFPTEPRVCPFCGSDSPPLFRRPDKLPVARCRICSCYYVAVSLSEETLTSFYARYWQDICPRPLTAELAIYLKASVGERLSADACLKKAAALLGSWEGKKVLDIGCGFGEKATIMQGLGAQVTGIDISESAVAFCRDMLGIPAFVRRPEHIREKALYDVVTMFEFCEHPLDPMAALTAALHSLKDGGLLIIVTPNGTAGDMTDIHECNTWKGFTVDLEHMQYLHVKTINYLANLLGCSIVHLNQFGDRAIDDLKPPKGGMDSLSWLRRLVKRLPGMRRFVYRARNVQRLFRQRSEPDQDNGNFHLFAILQKDGAVSHPDR